MQLLEFKTQQNLDISNISGIILMDYPLIVIVPNKTYSASNTCASPGAVFYANCRHSEKAIIVPDFNFPDIPLVTFCVTTALEDESEFNWSTFRGFFETLCIQSTIGYLHYVNIK